MTALAWQRETKFCEEKESRDRPWSIFLIFSCYSNTSKRSFFPAVVVSILLYGWTTWTLTKWLEKKLDGNYTRMLRAILNKSCRQHPTRHQLYGHLPPIMKTIQARRTRHAGICWRSKDKLISDVLLWTPAYGHQKQDDQLKRTYSSYVRIWDVALKTCQKRWMIGRSGERGSGISVLVAWHDDDDDDSNTYMFSGFVFITSRLVLGCLHIIMSSVQLTIFTSSHLATYWLFPVSYPASTAFQPFHMRSL